MVFSSLEFLFFFFPIVFGINYLLPIKLRNYWILLASLFFYAWGEPSFVILMMVSVFSNYALALRLDELEGWGRKIIFIFDLLINIGLLFIFKYMNFLTSIVHNAFPEGAIRETSIVLPIGISFFTFQALSYVIDVYKKKVPAQKSIANLGLYISLFPQLIAGPIVRYSSVIDQISDRKITLQGFSEGLMRFIVGFNKKVLLANILAEVADKAFLSKNLSASFAWLGALCYSLQILFDFSGYSDMAIGLGRMLGFTFLENFNYPYISKTVTEFWRRWHISLGSWFRDYVYFPLGGSKVKKGRMVVNLLIVWLLTGIWHGANWTFIVWGVLYGLVIIAEKLTGIPKKIDKWHISLRMVYRLFTLLLIMFGWVLFRSESLNQAIIYILSMFGLSNNTFIDDMFVFYSREYIVFIICGTICATPLFIWLKNIYNGRRFIKIISNIGYVLNLVFFLASISLLVVRSHNPFIYFNF